MGTFNGTPVACVGAAKIAAGTAFCTAGAFWFCGGPSKAPNPRPKPVFIIKREIVPALAGCRVHVTHRLRDTTKSVCSLSE